jgi:hypothetical protein
VGEGRRSSSKLLSAFLASWIYFLERIENKETKEKFEVKFV